MKCVIRFAIILKIGTFSPWHKINNKKGFNIIIHHNYFIFNNKYYKQNHRTWMESPISGLLDEYTFRPLDTKAKWNVRTSTFHLTHHTWHWYVDDISIISQYSLEELNSFTIIMIQWIIKLNSLLKFNIIKPSFPWCNVKQNKPISRKICFQKTQSKPIYYTR